MNSLKKQASELIKATRKAKGLTQLDVAQKLDISKGTYNRYENGEANLSMETVDKIANALGVKANISFH